MFLIYQKASLSGAQMTSYELKANRGRTDIMADILEMAMPGIKKTQLMQKANLNYEQLLFYLEKLQINELLRKVDENGSKLYRTTEMGREFLRCHKRLNEFIDENLIITMVSKASKMRVY
ncbi:MAG TPA: winged helix-turn-helix domain-containing protein [Nitrososphaera sp.]|nr:winged helix-turn-helix domain-containing protein [Nitrososphaera sp.]